MTSSENKPRSGSVSKKTNSTVKSNASTKNGTPASNNGNCAPNNSSTQSRPNGKLAWSQEKERSQSSPDAFTVNVITLVLVLNKIEGTFPLSPYPIRQVLLQRFRYQPTRFDQEFENSLLRLRHGKGPKGHRQVRPIPLLLGPKNHRQLLLHPQDQHPLQGSMHETLPQLETLRPITPLMCLPLLIFNRRSR